MPRSSTDRRSIQLVAGLALIAGGVVTLALHAAGAPEALLEFLYDKLLSGLDVPEEPSTTARDIVNYVSLIGGIAEIATGTLLIGLHLRRQRTNAAG